MATQTETAQAPAPAEPGLSPAAARRLVAAERVLYGAGGVLGAAGPQLLGSPWLDGAAVAAGAGTLVHLWYRTKAQDGPRLLVSCQRALPLLTWSGTYTACLVHPGTAWWEVLAPAAWAALMGAMAPVTRSRGLHRAAAALPERVAAQAQAPAPAPASASAQAGPADPYTDGLRRMWSASPATGGTDLVEVRQFSPERPDFEAVVLAPAGQAVPRTLDARTAAAVFDVPEAAVTLAPAEGYGPGRLALRVAPSLPQAPQSPGGGLEDLWTAHVSGTGGAAPGVALVGHRVEEDRITMRIAAPRGRTLRVDHAALCSALGIDDISRMVVEGAGPREAVLYIYRTNPLLHVRRPTAEDLTMDGRGRVSLGVAHDGSPARIMLFNPDTGRAMHGLTAGTTGAGKSGLMRLLGAAQRLSGVVSWMADVQGGMSMPEMEGRIDWMAKGQDATMSMLRTLHKVKVYREQHSSGRGDFDIHGPWSLLQFTGDEINRLLSSLDQEVRREAAWMIGDLMKTGQKVGIGVDLALQSLHLKELGDNHEIREKGKEGHVFLMRTASSSTQGMGLDGIAPPGAHISPIPERIYEGAGAQELFEGTAETEGVPTPGMAWLITEGRAVLMRTFVLEKVDGRYPQLEDLMDGCPMPTLTPGEAAAAGAAYTGRHAAAPQEREASLDAATHAPAPAQEPERAAEAHPAAAASAAVPSFTKEPTLRQRVLAALEGRPDGLALRDIRTAVGCGTEGGPSTGGVNNTVNTLTAEGALAALGGAVYRLP